MLPKRMLLRFSNYSDTGYTENEYTKVNSNGDGEYFAYSCNNLLCLRLPKMSRTNRKTLFPLDLLVNNYKRVSSG